MAFVFASRPVALAKSRTCRGFTPATGSPATAAALPQVFPGHPLPQVQSPRGSATARVPRGARFPPGSGRTHGVAPRPLRDIQLRFRDIDPTTHSTRFHRYLLGEKSPMWPSLARYGLAPAALATVRALGRKDVTNHAWLRPQWTLEESVYHVPLA